jgi:DNA-binding TFAR19-related protein (PDSD5 family)
MNSQAQWEAGTSAEEMLRAALRWAKNPERKARLYRVALVRRVWHEVPWITRVLTELAERRVDGTFDPATLPRTLAQLAEGLLYAIQFKRDTARDSAAILSSPALAECERHLLAAGYAKPPDADRTAARFPPARLHELAWLALGTHFEWGEGIDVSVGNGFRPVTFAPAWRTETAVTLARQMYDSRDFGSMPILADALQDAGCDCEQVLNHCRATGAPHVRGCWVVDGVLGNT